MGELLEFTKYTTLSNWSVSHLLESQFGYNKGFKLEKIGTILKRNKTQILVDNNTEYKRVKIRLYNKGVFLRDREYGKNIGTKKQFIIKKGQFLLSKIDARNGAFGLATDEVDGAIITADFFAYDINKIKIEPYFLLLITTTEKFQQFAQSASSGTTGRQRINESKFLDVKIPLPSLEIQQKIVKKYQDKLELSILQEQQAKEKEKEIEQFLYTKLGINFVTNPIYNILDFINYKKLSSWNYRDLFGSILISSNSFDTIKLNERSYYFIDLFRGKSPKYDINSKNTILNQKCNRWNNLELQYSKHIEDNWIAKIDKKFFTKEDDIIINSTGDGTIGRATHITKKFENLLYDSHMLLLRVNKLNINPLYLTYFINSSLGQKQIENLKSAIATKQTELGINNLKNIEFVLPPIKIQNEIALHIDNKKNEIKELKEKAVKNKCSALFEFEKEIFNEA